MTDQNLTELLERAAGRVAVGPAPVSALVSDAGRARRRRTLTLSLAGAASVAVVMGAAAAMTSSGGSPAPQPPATSPTPVTPTPGTRLVGFGHAAIAVPQGWGTNESRCGVPQEDTVVIDVGAVDACLVKRPKDVDSVEVTQGDRRFDFTADETLTVGGLPAERQSTTCARDVGNTLVCVGTVYLPSLRMAFRAESSTSAAEVDRILEWIQVVPDQVGVPGYQRIALNQQGKSGEVYRDALREAGFGVEIRTRKLPAVDPGYVLSVTPEPGTMLAPGAVVTVTVVAEPDGPADEVRIGINSSDAAGSDYKSLEDPEIRAGATIGLGVGDRIWAYADGKRANTLAGELDGDTLTVDGWRDGPNYPHSWVATAPGRTRITLTILADGARVVLGVVTVNVR